MLMAGESLAIVLVALLILALVIFFKINLKKVTFRYLWKSLNVFHGNSPYCSS